MLFAISIIQFATVSDKKNENFVPFCWKISITYYCKTIAILLRNSAILLTYCTIEYCNSAIPQHYCYCFVQYSEKLLAVSLLLLVHKPKGLNKPVRSSKFQNVLVCSPLKLGKKVESPLKLVKILDSPLRGRIYRFSTKSLKKPLKIYPPSSGSGACPRMMCQQVPVRASKNGSL